MKNNKAIASVLAACMIISLAGCSSNDSSDSKETKSSNNNGNNTSVSSELQTTIISNNGTKYYCTPYVYKIVDDNTSEPVMIYDKEKMSDTAVPDTMKEYYKKTGEKYDPKVTLSPFYFDHKTMAASENDYYGFQKYEYETIKHWSFMESDMVKAEDLYTAEDLKPFNQQIFDSTDYDEEYIKSKTLSYLDYSVEEILRREFESGRPDDEIDYDKEEKYINENKESYKSTHYDEIYEQVYKNESDTYYDEATYALNIFLNNPVDGGDGYIYSALIADNNHIDAYYPLDSKLVRFAKDGSKYEVIDGVSASEMTICDGYIYYYNSGCHEDDDISTSDANVRGIYKMKIDGSDEKKLADITNTSNTKDYISAISNMTVYNGYIYFIKFDDNYDIYRVSTEGGEPEKFSDLHCCNYTIDQSSNTIYYVGVEKNVSEFPNVVIAKSISDGSEKKIEYSDSSVMGVNCKDHGTSLQIDGDYLYINNPDESLNGHLVRMDGRTVSDNSNNEVTITELEYQMYYPKHAGERLNLKTGKLEYLFSYRNCKIDVDKYLGEKLSYIEPLNTEWKSTEEVNQILEPIFKKYNISTE